MLAVDVADVSKKAVNYEICIQLSYYLATQMNQAEVYCIGRAVV